MKKQIFESYYKRGFDHLMFKRVMRLKRPHKHLRVFYFALMAVLLATGLMIN